MTTETKKIQRSPIMGGIHVDDPNWTPDYLARVLQQLHTTTEARLQREYGMNARRRTGFAGPIATTRLPDED